MKENKNKDNPFKSIGLPSDLHQEIKEIAVDKQAKMYEIIKELLENYKNNNLK